MAKRQFTDVILGVVANLQDSVEQDHYLSRLAKQIDVSDEANAICSICKKSMNQPTGKVKLTT